MTRFARRCGVDAVAVMGALLVVGRSRRYVPRHRGFRRFRCPIVRNCSKRLSTPRFDS